MKVNICHVENLAEAEKTLAGDTYDVILADLMLPDSQGLHTLEC